MTDEPMTIGKFLAERRAARGMSQVELAKLAGCSHGMIGFIERGLRNPGADVAGKIANALGMKKAERAEFMELREVAAGRSTEARLDDVERTLLHQDGMLAGMADELRQLRELLSVDDG